jgi:hypothetical protein
MQVTENWLPAGRHTTGGVLFFGEHLQRQKTASGAEICSDIASLYFAEENRLFVYPNPVRQSGSFTVIINEQQSGELQVIDVNGRVLQRLVIENGGTIQLPAIRLPAGLYLLRLAGNNLKVRTGRVVVY